MTKRPVIGVDLGGTKVLVGIVAGGRVESDRKELVHGLGRDALLDVMTEMILSLREQEPEVSAIGLGIPSLIDQKRGVAMSTVNLPLESFPIVDYFKKHIDLPIAVENDANCAAIAEAKLGAGKDHSSVVCLTVGTGVGSGVVLDGKPIRGANGYATEVGHMVIDADGPPCFGSCPNHGCLEAFASGNALGRQTGKTGQEVIKLAAAGDAAMAETFERLARMLGVGIASVINIFNPDMVVIGGGIATAGDLLIKPARQEACKRALEPAAEGAKIELAQLGQRAGLIGAALVAEERFGA